MFWRRLPGGGRLSRPVCPGETVGTEMWREEGRRVVYRQVVRERVVVRNAVVELAGGKRGYDGGEEGVLVTSGGSRLSL